MLRGWGAILSCVLCLEGCTDIEVSHLDTLGSGAGASGTHASGGVIGNSADPRAGNSAIGAGASGAADTSRGGEGAAVDPIGATAGIAMVGTPCAPDGAKACTGRDGTETVTCQNAMWVPGQDCSSIQRCDTAAGMTQGMCLPMLSLCAGKKTGDPVCDGYTRRRCGSDLLRFEEFGCAEHAHCEGTSVVKCACDLNYKDDGSGRCVPNVICPANACLPGGVCVAGESDYHCECGVDHEGTGTKACVVTGRCAEANTCTNEYVCRNQDATYVCRGQFADWKMPSRMSGAAVAPAYTVTPETVVDEVTGLTWQRILPESYPGCTAVCTWAEAKAYCDALELEGSKDWRLPARIELVSILDDDAVMPSIDSEAFPDTPPETFWTASTFAGDASGAWVVKFGVFQSTAEPKNNGFRVRCVR